MSDTLSKMQTIISEQLGVDIDKVVLDASFTKDLGADSLDVVELVMAFEEKFDIEIDDESAGRIETVKDALDYIEQATK